MLIYKDNKLVGLGAIKNFFVSPRYIVKINSILFKSTHSPQEDADTAKYVARLALLQRQFYKSSKANLRYLCGNYEVFCVAEEQLFIFKMCPSFIIDMNCC